MVLLGFLILALSGMVAAIGMLLRGLHMADVQRAAGPPHLPRSASLVGAVFLDITGFGLFVLAASGGVTQPLDH